VSEPEGIGAGVLIRALEPCDGIELMRARRGRERLEDLCSGPGKLTMALGIELDHNGLDLGAGPVTISLPEGPARDIVVSRRIGITKAVDLPWRFSVRGSRFVSRGGGGGRAAGTAALSLGAR
jgi:DNA-3-methyladenine glycosylase